ncbi:MAG: hypothetical protein Q9168_002736 [Polycauliona sp. 1 TL-2023]
MADNLTTISAAADGRGSLIRIQHLAFFGLRCQIEGNTLAIWEVLGRAIRTAQSIDVNSDVTRPQQGGDETDQNMERRLIYNLYIWDSLLSRQLDYAPFIPGSLLPKEWQQLNRIRSGGWGESIEPGLDALDPFAERVLQARLADFWRSCGPLHGTEYDMVAGEERYDKFCSEFLPQLPAVFALVDADRRWDKRLPKLPLQRQLLHIAIYDSLCWNFRPLLLLHDHRLSDTLPLPVYKRVLLESQRTALAVAALHAIHCVTQLHALLGGSLTHLAGSVFSTFEAAVVLVYLCMDPMFPRDYDQRQGSPPGTPNSNTNPLHTGMHSVTRHGCLQAVQGALNRLRMLAESNSRADIGASTLTHLLSKVPGIGSRAGTETRTESNETLLSQAQETATTTTSSTKTANPRLGATSAAGEMANWLPYGPTDSCSIKNFHASMDETSMVGDIASWPPFNPTSMDGQNDCLSIETMQDMQRSYTTSTLDFGYAAG